MGSVFKKKLEEASKLNMGSAFEFFVGEKKLNVQSLDRVKVFV